MVTSCFFCQNLLSDFAEGILPSSRHEELKKHLDGCKNCSDTHRDLINTVEILKAMPLRSSSQEMSLRIAEAVQAGRRTLLTGIKVKKPLVYATAAVIALFVFLAAFPRLSISRFLFRGTSRQSDFVRYYPLMQGASEILAEQGNWLHIREPLMGSLWEEGGLSPDEFEKTFQIKGAKGEEK